MWVLGGKYFQDPGGSAITYNRSIMDITPLSISCGQHVHLDVINGANIHRIKDSSCMPRRYSSYLDEIRDSSAPVGTPPKGVAKPAGSLAEGSGVPKVHQGIVDARRGLRNEVCILGQLTRWPGPVRTAGSEGAHFITQHLRYCCPLGALPCGCACGRRDAGPSQEK